MSEFYERYDYAWQQEGWSVQNPSMSGGVDTYVEPGLPPDVAMVKIFGKFMEHTGRGLEGVFSWRVRQWRTHVPTGTQVAPSRHRHRFRKGAFAIHLPATDDPQLTPPVRYEATLTVAGYKREFSFLLPADPDEINVLDLILDEGYIDLEPSEDGEGLALGSVPQKLTVHLVKGGDFNPVLTLDEPWPNNALVTLVFDNNTEWNSTVDGENAFFDVDKAVSDEVEDGLGVRLVVTVAGADEVWAAGRVLRHD